MGVAHRRAYIAHKDFSLYYKQEREMRGGATALLMRAMIEKISTSQRGY